jgi:Ca2+-binding RTX toxin-like protein
MHNAMAAIQQVVQAKHTQGAVFTIDDLTHPTVSAPVLAGIADQATDHGLAYRYALKELNPFAIIADTPQANEALYQAHNEQGQLIRVNPIDGTGSLTAQYLTDRALFLKEKIALNQLDLEQSSGNIHFQDVTPHGSDITTVVDLREDREFLFGSDHADTLTGGNQADHLYGGGSVDVLIGHAGRDYLEGNEGSDRLEGGAGADMMAGGSGNDTYLVDDLGDQVIEVGDNGRDRVESSVTFSLVGTTVEELILTPSTGSEQINGVGNHLDNQITGNNGINRLEGHGGTDHLIGNDGNDVLIGGTGDADLLEGGIGFDTYIP